MPELKRYPSLPMDTNDPSDSSQASAKPFKLVTRRSRVQFTCSFKEVRLGGRADLKALKTLVSTVAARQVVVMHGKGHDSDAIAAHARNAGALASAPGTGEALQLLERGERLRVELPQSLIHTAGRLVSGESLQAGPDKNKRVNCCVATLSGEIRETVASGVGGTRAVRWIGVKSGHADEVQKAGHEQMTPAAQRQEELPAASDALQLPLDAAVGAVSVGEVLLESLRQQLERIGVSTEYRLSSSGGYLVCGGQVILKKERENDFVLEGPPIAAYFMTRKMLYEQFAFL